MSLDVRRRTYTVDEFDRMGEVGILSEDDRVELIEGEIVEMAAIGRRHMAVVNRLNAIFTRRAGDDAIISVQNPIHIDDRFEPQPDIAILRYRSDFYEDSRPMPVDVLLLVEVADSSLDFDRTTKLPSYARAGISETWIVNLVDDVIEVYADPVGGAYTDTRRIERDGVIRPRRLPDITVPASDIL